MDKVENSHISAYVDKELNEQQVEEFENSMMNNPSLMNEVANYIEIKDKIKLSYGNAHSKKYKNYHACAKKGNFWGIVNKLLQQVL